VIWGEKVLGAGPRLAPGVAAALVGTAVVMVLV
jgi:hypothetical protein